MDCEHDFFFVRQDIRDNDDGSFHPELAWFDVFACKKCLAYRTIKVAENITYGDGRKERKFI